jgi:hypothetical protein
LDATLNALDLGFQAGGPKPHIGSRHIILNLETLDATPRISITGCRGSRLRILSKEIHFDRRAYVKLYVIPRSRDPVVIPVHRVQWTIRLPNGVEQIFNESCEFLPENDDVARRDQPHTVPSHAIGGSFVSVITTEVLGRNLDFHWF